MYYHTHLYHIKIASEQMQSIAFSVQYYSDADEVYEKYL